MCGILMFKLTPFKHLPKNLTPKKLHLKILLGVLLVSLFLGGYQPTLGFPPIKKSVARAQSEQTQRVNAQEVPVKFQMPHPFSMISTYYSWYHQGIDLATPLGTPIRPVASGVITEAGYNFWGLGLTTVVDHGSGYQSLYAHMGKIYLKKGDKVTENSIMGEVGMTGHTSGPHTHLQISKNGVNIDPLTVLPLIKN
jgi:murein DD-endopeptidase MepM/ murein hydrolase activator NlpD